MPSFKQKAPKGQSPKDGATITDPRFKHIQTDPRFRLPSKKHTKVKLDKRFARMLKDDEFSQKSTVDRYGRKVEKAAGRKELERFYRVEEEEEEQDDNDDDGYEDKASRSESENDDKIEEELVKMNRKYDPAREGGFSESSSESESDDGDEENEELPDAELAGEAHDLEVPMGEASARLAAVNLDWDNIRAIDIMAVASSFVPEGRCILNVAVYPSEFGRERIEREELEGPPREIFGDDKKEADGGDDEEFQGFSSDSDGDTNEKIKKQLLQEDKGEEFNSTALRTYQLERLRYYYAVIFCDAVTTAQALYNDMDGREYLSSANFFDLRFIPDETSFDEDKPRDKCDKVPDGYKPNEFVTDALTHSKVKLTWDADDCTRQEVLKRAFSGAELDENDLQAYIGSDSSSGGEDENPELKTSDKASSKEVKAASLRAALGLLPTQGTGLKKEKPEAITVTFTPALSGRHSKQPVIETEETTVEKYIRKERERKQRRKERAKATRVGTSASDQQDTDTDLLSPDPPDAKSNVAQEKERKSSIKQSKSVSAEVELEGDQGAEDSDPFNDPFFTNPVASITAEKAMRKVEKQRKKKEREAAAEVSAQERAELELLMLDDNAEATQLRHFNIDEIQKAEKAARKKKGKKKRRKGQDEGEEGTMEMQKGFRMDVMDPRFAKLYVSHEYAIDPTNPRFRDTEGMKALLEEGRRKRAAHSESYDGEGEGRAGMRKKVKRQDEGERTKESIKSLIERVKKKSKQVG